MRLAVSAVVFAAIWGGASAWSREPARSQEVVEFFPTYAWLDEAGQTWNVSVHGVVYEPEADSVKRALAVAAVRRLVGIEAGTPESAILERRLRLFLVDLTDDKPISIRLGGREYAVGKSQANGHFSAELRLAAPEADRLVRSQPVPDGWLPLFTAESEDTPQASVGRVQLIGPSGLSVISDIDDTIKETQVSDRKAMLANTFCRVFRPVLGMAEVYQELARQGTAFHYVSGSPWQLYSPLAEFLRVRGFPAGSMHLKLFRMTDATALNLVLSQEATKLDAIEPILAAFPKRRFVLVGDSGEEDPEIYGKIARKHPDQVVAILIRNVTDEAADGARMRRAMEGVERRRWELFERPQQIRELLGKLNELRKTAG